MASRPVGSSELEAAGASGGDERRRRAFKPVGGTEAVIFDFLVRRGCIQSALALANTAGADNCVPKHYACLAESNPAMTSTATFTSSSIQQLDSPHQQQQQHQHYQQHHQQQQHGSNYSSIGGCAHSVPGAGGDVKAMDIDNESSASGRRYRKHADSSVATTMRDEQQSSDPGSRLIAQPHSPSLRAGMATNPSANSVGSSFNGYSNGTSFALQQGSSAIPNDCRLQQSERPSKLLRLGSGSISYSSIEFVQLFSHHRQHIKSLINNGHPQKAIETIATQFPSVLGDIRAQFASFSLKQLHAYMSSSSNSSSSLLSANSVLSSSLSYSHQVPLSSDASEDTPIALKESHQNAIGLLHSAYPTMTQFHQLYRRFRLECLVFIELIRTGNVSEAQIHGKSKFHLFHAELKRWETLATERVRLNISAPTTDSLVQDLLSPRQVLDKIRLIGKAITEISGLFVYTQPSLSPLQHLLSPEYKLDIANEIDKAIVEAALGGKDSLLEKSIKQVAVLDGELNRLKSNNATSGVKTQSHTHHGRRARAAGSGTVVSYYNLTRAWSFSSFINDDNDHSSN
ncbi:hypothetical protein GQ42DRAFT_161714 [Ramicandelaber brevisporus]|nr:hypothetical protein GQ42DRAFT_161714 [Ramicandelaber brevisporus]